VIPMGACDRFLHVLDLARDGEASPAEAREARDHAAACRACAAAIASIDAVSARLAERAGPPGAAAPDGLREAVLARLRAGEPAVLELHPFLRRAAVAAAVLFVAATATALWQSARDGGPRRLDGGIPREEILAELGKTRPGPGR
jgi:anti-sigma factor RsiW